MSNPTPLGTAEHCGHPASSPRRWDPVVKVTHWSIVAAILANALFTEEGSGPHIWVGYALAAVLALRLLWGLIGPAEARFSAFPPSLRRAFDHVRDIRSGRNGVHRSHNPLGALMVYAIWIALGVIIASGIAMSGAPSTAFLDQPSYQAERSREAGQQAVVERGHDQDGAKGEEEGAWGEVHETAVNLLYILIVVHVAGVAFETRRSGKEILLAMLPARR